MAQKNKVKELVGRGLNSYHTKALQQMDRIEKKNKEQNHKISILSNELDNDYLTKTEESSVVSLEHSKEGMVYLDEIQGNTMVNYCTDGSKEMTLNGDIDVEGTFVTTTEGVDNGLVDVMCEGNTLVNKLYKIKNYGSITEFLNHGWNSGVANCNRHEWLDNGIKIYSTLEDTSTDRYYRSTPEKYGIFKKNRTYIVRMNVNSNDFGVNATILRCFYGNGRTFMSGALSDVKNGVFVKKATTSSEIEECDAIHSMISLDYIRPLNTEGWVSFQNVMVIDVTDLPSYQQDIEYWRNMNYFEGMKSVGQDDENGHKIEILSQNTIKITDYFYGTQSNGSNAHSPSWTSLFFKCKPNTTYTVEKLEESNRFGIEQCFYNGEGKSTTGNTELSSYTDNSPIKTFTTKDISYGDYIKVYLSNQQHKQFNVFITESSGDIDSLNYKSNKKEILINEPLRGLPNGVKDRFVKIGGKWFIERNVGCKDLVVTGGTNWGTQVAEGMIGFHGILDMGTNYNGTNFEVAENIVCDKLPSIRRNQLSQTTYDAIIRGNTYVGIIVKADKLETQDLDGFKKYINSLNAKFIYNLATPTYEPLEIDPTINTYTDTTHISNNSIIPCNMKIKNSGYNAIIKPSTLYTVALDTNKSVTIGINLGGAKITTTNNVATITTPATLTDDSLRLYGKGIKGSKVRILEGDKTNWTPSFFEGMQSSFEDKVQEDGSYKMEILSNNKNLFNLDNFELGSYGEIKNGIITVKNPRQGLYDSAGVFKLKTPSCFKGKWITLSTNKTQGEGNIEIRQYDISNNQIWVHVSSTSSFKVLDSCEYISLNFNSRTTGTTTSWENIQIEISNSKTSYIEPKSNKIQFSSIEPLRGIGDIKDRFVFKDDKLMIERNCGTGSLDGTASIYHCWTNNQNDIVSGYIYYHEHKPEITNIKQHSNVVCTDLPNNRGGHISTVEGFRNTAYFAFSIHKSKLGIEDINAGEVNQNIVKRYFTEHPLNFVYQLAEPTYEEVPYELQKIILEGYENGTLFFDTNIPPTSTVTYAGETPIVKATKLNKTEVLNNTNDINDNIIPYLMDMDYRVVMLQLATEELEGGVSMARLFGGTYEMIKRDILSKRLTREEYGYRLADYYNAGKLTEEQVRELEDLR